MSRSVDLFIGAGLPLGELAAALSERLQLAAQADPERNRYVVAHEGVTLFLHAHPYVDDQGLPFTRYPYALSAVVANGGRPQDSAEAGVLRKLAQRIQQGPAWPVLLVLDLQFRDPALHPGAPGPTDGGEAGGPDAAAPADAAVLASAASPTEPAPPAGAGLPGGDRP
jgi:hypothetical protein